MAAIPLAGHAAGQHSRARRFTLTRRQRWLMVGACVFVYPLVLLLYVYGHAFVSGLPGGRHGPLDAYRHTLASAFLAYTISPRAVDVVTRLMESSADLSSVMDRHNNAIGAAIGAQATSWREVQPLVKQRVLAGGVLATDPQRVMWMPPSTWNRLPF